MSQEDLDEEIRKAKLTLHEIYVDIMIRFIEEHHLKYSPPEIIAKAYDTFTVLRTSLCESRQNLGLPIGKKNYKPDQSLIDLVIEALISVLSKVCPV